MDENKNNEDKLEDFNEESVIDKIIEKYDLDAEEDEDLIIKLVSNEKESYSKLSKAIGQKIEYRNKFAELQQSPNLKEDKSKESAKAETSDVSKAVQEALDKRDLEEMNLPEELEEELKKISKVQNISFKKAMNDPYFIYKKEAYEKSDTLAKATISKKNVTATGTIDTSTPPKVDLSTSEGRKVWNDWKKAVENSSK